MPVADDAAGFFMSITIYRLIALMNIAVQAN
jgi:hypothetical protein